MAFLRGIIIYRPTKSEITGYKENPTTDHENISHSTNMPNLVTIQRPIFEIYLHKVRQ